MTPCGVHRDFPVYGFYSEWPKKKLCPNPARVRVWYAGHEDQPNTYCEEHARQVYLLKRPVVRAEPIAD